MLYETYRTEKLSRTVHNETQYVALYLASGSPALIRHLIRDSSILPEELATQSVRLKEEQLRREEEKVRIQIYVGNISLILCGSCARSSCVSNGRSTKRGKNYWPRKSR